MNTFKMLLRVTVVLAPPGAVLAVLLTTTGNAVFWFLGIFFIMLMTMMSGSTARRARPLKPTARALAAGRGPAKAAASEHCIRD